MRIDKFLWCVRVFKTRSLSTAACRAGKVFVNDAPCKPSRTVKIGEEVVVRKGAIRFSYKVVSLPKSRVGPKLVEDFCTNTTDPLEIEKLEMIRLANKDTFRKKPGRPSKKDRRDLDDFFR